jgi:hypothetical protein
LRIGKASRLRSARGVAIMTMAKMVPMMAGVMGVSVPPCAVLRLR